MTRVTQRGLVSETEGDTMNSQAGHRGGGSQLHPNQSIKSAGKNVLSRLRTFFQVLGSICFRWQLLFLCTIMAFRLIHAHGHKQTGVCKLLDPGIIIWDRISAVNSETIGLCPCSAAEPLPIQWMNSSIFHGHLNMENHSSPYPLQPPTVPSRANVTEVVVTVLASFGGIGLVGLAGWMLCKRRPAFTEADINRGFVRGPAVARRSDPTFNFPLSIVRNAN